LLTSSGPANQALVAAAQTFAAGIVLRTPGSGAPLLSGNVNFPIAIGAANVLIPSVIKWNLPSALGAATTAYVMAVNLPAPWEPASPSAREPSCRLGILPLLKSLVRRGLIDKNDFICVRIDA
jgi:hypothetical protein